MPDSGKDIATAQKPPFGEPGMGLRRELTEVAIIVVRIPNAPHEQDRVVDRVRAPRLRETGKGSCQLTGY